MREDPHQAADLLSSLSLSFPLCVGQWPPGGKFVLKLQQCCLQGQPLWPALEGETGNPFYWGRRASMGEARARNPGASLNWQAKCHSVSQPLEPVGNLQVLCELGRPQGWHPASRGTQCPVPSFSSLLSGLLVGKGLSGLPSGGQL